MGAQKISPPRDVDELVARALALAGKSLGDIASIVGGDIADDATHAKGKLGELLERALGATGGSRAQHDFPEIQVELKTVPVDENARPRESTYVCKIQLNEADEVEWEDSWVRKKLSCVLFVPIVTPEDAPWNARRVGHAVLFRPSEEQDAMLRRDFEDAMGLIAMGRVDELTAHRGEVLQVRPKAKDGSARTLTFGPEREAILAMPRGFYLRPKFTQEILKSRF